MNVKELIEQLRNMPPDAEVVTAKYIDGAWTVTGKTVELTRYQNIDVCVIREGYE